MTGTDSWPTRLGNMQRTGKAAEGLALPLKLSWKREFPGVHLWASAAIADNVVYFSSGPAFHALSLEDGAIVWELPDVSTYGTGAPTIHGDTLFTAGFFHARAIEVQSGEIRWQQESEKLIANTSPAVSGDSVFWGAADGFLYAADIETGALKWKFQAGPGWVYFAPTVFADTVYFSTERATFYALDVLTGAVKWRRQFKGSTSSPNNSAALDDGRLFVSVLRGGLYALDAMSGDTIWHCPILHGPWTAPTVAGDIVYVGSSQLYAIDAKEGEELWISSPRSLLRSSAPVISGDYILTGGGHEWLVCAYDRRTGERVWSYETEGDVHSTAAVASGKLIIGSLGGVLYCFEEENHANDV
jgi:outer membrane protein assembly factor BamB